MPLMEQAGIIFKKDGAKCVVPIVSIVKDLETKAPLDPGEDEYGFNPCRFYKVKQYLCPSLRPEESHAKCSDPNCQHLRGYMSAKITCLGETREQVAEKLEKKRGSAVPARFRSNDSDMAIFTDSSDCNAQLMVDSNVGKNEPEISGSAPIPECKTKKSGVDTLVQIKQERSERLKKKVSTSLERAHHQFSKFEKRNSPRGPVKVSSPRSAHRRPVVKSLQFGNHNTATNHHRRGPRGRRPRVNSQSDDGSYDSKDVRLFLAERDAALHQQDLLIKKLQNELAKLAGTGVDRSSKTSTATSSSQIQEIVNIEEAEEEEIPTRNPTRTVANSSQGSSAGRGRQKSRSTRQLVDRYTKGYHEIQQGQSRPRKRRWAIVADAEFYYHDPQGGGYAESEKRYKVPEGETDIFITESLRMNKTEWDALSGNPDMSEVRQALTLFIWQEDDLANMAIEPEKVKPEDYIKGRDPIQPLEYEKLRLLISILDDVMTVLRPKSKRVPKEEKLAFLRKVPAAVSRLARTLRREIQKKQMKMAQNVTHQEKPTDQNATHQEKPTDQNATDHSDSDTGI